METWMWVVGAIVLALVVVVALVWQFWWKPKKQAENHYHLFRHRLWRGKDSVLGEKVREVTLTDLSARVVLLQGFVDDCEAKRYTASSVVDLQRDDAELLREVVKTAAADLARAEDLEKILRPKSEVADIEGSDSASSS